MSKEQKRKEQKIKEQENAIQEQWYKLFEEDDLINVDRKRFLFGKTHSKERFQLIPGRRRRVYWCPGLVESYESHVLGGRYLTFFNGIWADPNDDYDIKTADMSDDLYVDSLPEWRVLMPFLFGALTQWPPFSIVSFRLVRRDDRKDEYGWEENQIWRLLVGCRDSLEKEEGAEKLPCSIETLPELMEKLCFNMELMELCNNMYEKFIPTIVPQIEEQARKAMENRNENSEQD